MRLLQISLPILIVTAAVSLVIVLPIRSGAGGDDWHFNGTVIEACSCPMFCPCYFNTEPALNHTDHGAEHFCRFSMAYRINQGHYGATNLTGVKFWVAGDLGADWKDGTTDWAVVTFQTGTSAAQKSGVTAILGHMFPVKWRSFEVAPDAAIAWAATEERAEAKLDGGRQAHIVLNKWSGMDGKTAVFENLAYFAVPRNDGFKMMPTEIESWKRGDKAFEYRGTTGFMVTVDMRSDDLAM